MAFHKYNQGDSSWIADSVADLSDLPLSNIGSTCYVISNASKYMVNSKGEWIRQTFPKSEEGGSDITAAEIAEIYLAKEDAKNEYLSKKEATENYLTIEEIEEKYISKEEVSEKYVSKEEVKLSELKKIKYEVLGLPKNSIVDHREKEIRVLIPENTEWSTQNVGEGGNPNMWYFQFKAYAPEDAEYFKEDDAEEIQDETLYEFINNKTAGIDSYGRKYSTFWLAAAVKNGETWTYFGTNSTKDHMLGFYYTVEWYNKEKELIGMDKIRINLTNKECHSMIEPFYFKEFTNNLTWKQIEE